MKRYSVVMGTRGPKEYAAGGRDVAREGFLHHLRCRDARALQSIVDSDLRVSTVHDSPRLHDLKIRRAHVRQDIVDRDIKASNQCGSAWRRQMRREKNQRDRTRRYFANEKLKSANLDLKIRRARLLQDLADLDVGASRRGA